MRGKSLLLFVLCLLYSSVSGQLTLPFMKINHQIRQSSLLQKHHLHKMYPSHQADIETYKLLSHGHYYSLELKINGLPYNLSIDTGSSDLFIKSSQMGGQPSKKISIQPYKNNKKVPIAYLDGGLDTYVGQVQVQIGQHKFNQSALIAYKSQTKNYNDKGGILGLSYQQKAQNQNPTFINTLINNKIINKNGYGINMNFKDKQRGFITFGGYDPKFIDGQMKYFNFVSNNTFIISMTGIKINNKEKQLIPIEKAILDTGNTCLSIPKNLQSLVIGQFSKNQNNQSTGNTCFFVTEKHAKMFSIMLCQVKSIQQLPQISIFLNNQTQLKIQKQFYMKKCHHYKNSKQWYCQSYIELVSDYKQLFLGDTFFNRFYTFFDLQNHRVGIGKNVQHPSFDQVLLNDQLDQQTWKTYKSKLHIKENPQQNNSINNRNNILDNFWPMITNLI